jgi:hypothetical protein
MHSRREFIASAAAYTALSGVALTDTGCAAKSSYDNALRVLRNPLDEFAKNGTLQKELVRCAVLAPDFATLNWPLSMV